MITYKQIIQDLSGVAYYHPQINSFGIGDITQITMDVETNKEPVYTKMYVIPGLVTLSENAIKYDFSIIILDQINSDYSNQKDVMSDTLEITKDIFTILYRSYTEEYGGFTLDYNPLFGPNVTPFLEKYETILAGWTLNITIEQPFNYDSCILPINVTTLTDSLNKVNYKQILTDFESFSNQHKQINSYGFGDLYQLTMDVVTNRAPLYPRLYVLPQDTVLNENELRYNFQIIIADQLNDDYSNQRDVLNDTLETMKDIYIMLHTNEYESEWDASIEPFLDRFEDKLTGWIMNVTLSQPFDYNRCDLPERSFLITNKKWYELDQLWNKISTIWTKT